MKEINTDFAISTQNFTYSKADSTFVTEASSLKHIPNLRYALDEEHTLVGFWLKSAKTGRLEPFVFNREVRISGDLVSTEYKSAKIRDLMVIIWND